MSLNYTFISSRSSVSEFWWRLHGHVSRNERHQTFWKFLIPDDFLANNIKDSWHWPLCANYSDLLFRSKIYQICRAFKPARIFHDVDGFSTPGVRNILFYTESYQEQNKKICILISENILLMTTKYFNFDCSKYTVWLLLFHNNTIIIKRQSINPLLI